MNRYIKTGAAAAGLLVLLFASGCSSSPAAAAQVHSLTGGCAGTVLTDATPPVWAQGGWTHTSGAQWGVPWAMGTEGTSVAYVFAGQLVAGASPRVNGTNNKVLWESRDDPSGAGVTVEGRPLGQTQPVVTIAGGPSITDVPTAGCWTFRLSWGSNGQHSSTINLQVLPTGALPS